MDTGSWIMFALMQVLAEDATFSDVVLEIIAELESSKSTGVQQQSYEMRKLLSNLPRLCSLMTSGEKEVCPTHSLSTLKHTH